MYLGKLSKKEKKDETIWETILVCFENYVSMKSALEVGFLNNNNNTTNNNTYKHCQNYYSVESLNCICKPD